jgi:hypothetical protein
MQQNLTRYRVLEMFAQRIAELEVADTASIEKLIGKVKREAKKALNHKDVPRNKNMKEARVKAKEATIRKAREFRAEMMAPIEKAKKAGCKTTRQIAEWLNNHGYQSPRGFKWTSGSVYRQVTGDDPV